MDPIEANQPADSRTLTDRIEHLERTLDQLQADHNRERSDRREQLERIETIIGLSKWQMWDEPPDITPRTSRDYDKTAQ